MDKKIASLLGAVAALGTVGGAQASSAPVTAPTDILQANSYADLLQPIPNAAALLRVVDERTPDASAQPTIKLAQAHHHHHHHHAYSRRHHRHHHHHHHRH